MWNCGNFVYRVSYGFFRIVVNTSRTFSVNYRMWLLPIVRCSLLKFIYANFVVFELTIIRLPINLLVTSADSETFVFIFLLFFREVIVNFYLFWCWKYAKYVTYYDNVSIFSYFHLILFLKFCGYSSQRNLASRTISVLDAKSNSIFLTIVHERKS